MYNCRHLIIFGFVQHSAPIF